MAINSKMKGQYSEAKALLEFQKRNIPVALPWGDNERYDMIAEFNGKLNRIQVKTCNEEKNGGVVCYCRSSTNHTTNKSLDTYEGQVDYFVFVNQTYDIIALVPIEETHGQKSMTLRLAPAKNGASKGVKFFSDFSFDKILGS